MKFGSNKGFSLIEVMVAVAILMTIVLMVGKMFREATNTFETGSNSAEGTTGVRSVLGSIERELVQAIDGREYGLDDPVDVKENTITFYRYADPAKKGTDERELQLIKYTFGRNSVVRSQDGSSVTIFSKQSSMGSKSDVDVDFTVGKIKISDSDLDINDDFKGEIWTVPSVWVRASIVRKSTFSELQTLSCGPDGKKGTKDDIIVK